MACTCTHTHVCVFYIELTILYFCHKRKKLSDNLNVVFILVVPFIATLTSLDKVFAQLSWKVVCYMKVLLTYTMIVEGS